MANPWENISLDIYENHMRLPEVNQLQTLNKIMCSQLCNYTVSSAAILGVAGGNGLEHIEGTGIKTIYGIDINRKYLDACRERYGYLGEKLVLLNLDLSDLSARLPNAELVIADLFIEYIGIDKFIKQLTFIRPEYVSCVVQKNTDNRFVSKSPYINNFNGISALHNDIQEEKLTDAIKKTGYNLVLKEIYPLPNGKSFIRLDFRLRRA